MNKSKFVIYTDGGSRGNPGPAAVGVVVEDASGKMVKTWNKAIGRATNNEAEYEAVIFALQKIKHLYGKEKVKEMEFEFRLDSELVVNQLSGKFKIEEEKLQPLFLKIHNLKLDFGPIVFVAIPREQNHHADELVNEALDKEQRELF